MSNSTKLKVSRSGCWDPYVPKMGVERGCRAGVRNESENFNILHISRKYQDDSLQNIQKGSSCHSTQSSFEPGSVVPKAAPEMLTAQPGVASQRYSNALSGSLKPGLIAECVSRNAPRPHAGRVSQGTLRAGMGVEYESQEDPIQPRRRINAETFVPPDNIGRGLRPYREFSQEIPTSKCSHNIYRDSLGPGLVPVVSNPDHMSNTSETCNGERRSCENLGDNNGAYKRVYGARSVMRE